MSISITVTATGSGSLSVGSVTDTQADVTIGSATTVDLVVNNGVGPAGSGNVTLAAGTGITIATADGTSTISATAVDVSTSNLSDLANVNSTTPSTGQVLTYTASNEWAPANVASADHAHDVPTFQEITNGTATTTSDLNLDPATGVVIVQGGTVGSGSLTLNCENNSHGVTIKGPPHSSNATYSLTLPDGVGTSGQVLSSDGTGFLQWITPSSGSGSGGVSWSSAPTSTSSTGTPGDIAYDNNYFYVMTASGWRRTALAGWGQSIIINTQPANVTTGDATTATFSVNATAPLGSLNYQWQVSTNSGISWADITGANGSSYSFTAGVSDDGNQYRVVLSATSATSDEISDVVTLTVAVTNYITTESGDPLDAENGDNILHDGIGAGTGSGGGGSGGGSSTLASLTPADRVSGGAYTMDGPAAPNDISIGWALPLTFGGLEFDYSGTTVLAHLGNSAYVSTQRTPTVYRESSTNNWQTYDTLSSALGNRKHLPRGAAIDDDGNYVAALYTVTLNSYDYVALAYQKNTGVNFNSFSSNGVYIKEQQSFGSDNVILASSSGAGPESAYRCSMNKTGARCAVSIPYKNTDPSSPQAGAYQEGFIRVYDALDSNGTLNPTFFGSDIIPPTNTGSSHNYNRWRLGNHLLKLNTEGTKICFSGQGNSDTVKSHLFRYHYESGSWVAKAGLDDILDGRASISQDLSTLVARDPTNTTVTFKVYNYNNTSDSWSETTTLTNPTFAHDTNYSVSATDVNRDGTRIAITYGNLDDPDGNAGTGAVVVYRLDGSTWSQYTEPYYGAQAGDNLAKVRISGDGQKVAAASALPDGGSGTDYRGRIYVWDVPTVASDNPVITNQPTSVVNSWPATNNYASYLFSISASNESGETIAYQWQYSQNGYSGWTDAPSVFNLNYGTFGFNDGVSPNNNSYRLYLENSGASGNNEAELWEGVAWRCVLTSGGLTTTSATAYSYVQRLEVSGTTGGTSPYSCNVNTTSNSTSIVYYQWYEFTNNTWSPISNAIYQTYAVQYSGTYIARYKCLVTNNTNSVEISQYGPTNTITGNYS